MRMTEGSRAPPGNGLSAILTNGPVRCKDPYRGRRANANNARLGSTMDPEGKELRPCVRCWRTRGNARYPWRASLTGSAASSAGASAALAGAWHGRPRTPGCAWSAGGAGSRTRPCPAATCWRQPLGRGVLQRNPGVGVEQAGGELADDVDREGLWRWEAARKRDDVAARSQRQDRRELVAGERRPPREQGGPVEGRHRGALAEQVDRVRRHRSPSTISIAGTGESLPFQL